MTAVLEMTREQVKATTLRDEIERFNETVGNLPVDRRPIIETAFGPHYVKLALVGPAVVCYPVGGDDSYFSQDTVVLENDDRWAGLLSAVGIDRRPTFAK